MGKFREMRRKEKQVSEPEAWSILENAPYMTLATVLEDGQPYAVPLNHIVMDRKVYFHSATEGQKCDAFRGEERVFISAVEGCEILPAKFSTNFRSVSIFGKISPVEDRPEKQAALEGLIEKFSPGFAESGSVYIEKLFDKTAVYRVDMEHITGKVSNRPG